MPNPEKPPGITFFLPGMFTVDGVAGKYPAVSITGGDCALGCDHCRGKILETMIPATTPERLEEVCLGLRQKGNLGVLISGGCDKAGRLPWSPFISSLKRIKHETGLFISAHCGLIDGAGARRLKRAGVDQALIDVVGDNGTYEKICHLTGGVSKIISSLHALQAANLPVIPHIVCGLDYGGMKGEERAVEIVSRFRVRQLVILSLMGIPGTPLYGIPGPSPREVSGVIARARARMPRARISLGCARQRGNVAMEIMAIDAGVHRMALPSGAAMRYAEKRGLTVTYQKTCCSVPPEGEFNHGSR